MRRLQPGAVVFPVLLPNMRDVLKKRVKRSTTSRDEVIVQLDQNHVDAAEPIFGPFCEQRAFGPFDIELEQIDASPAVHVDDFRDRVGTHQIVLLSRGCLIHLKRPRIGVGIRNGKRPRTRPNRPFE